jgi:hypothetical protein
MHRLIFFCFLLLWSAVAIAQPKIQIHGDSTYDFDRLYQGETVKATFEVKNAGTDTLVINKVESSCGCTAALASADKVAPNEIAKITATFHSTGILGPVKKYVTVLSNDPERPTIEFVLEGSVVVEIDTDQPNLSFEQAVIGKSIKASITLKNVVSKPITLVDIENPYSTITTDFKRKTLQPSEEMTLNATMVPKEPMRLFGAIKVLTDSDRQKIVEIKVFADVVMPEPSSGTKKQ